ncbi:MAG: hypothetical protein SGPRY_004599 [Prymnesium sp.]
MDRLFGKSKPAAARPTLQDAHSSMEKRGESIDQKIMKLDKELGRYTEQLKKMKPGPAKQQVQKRAMAILKQKKMYEGQKEQTMNQQFNMDQGRAHAVTMCLAGIPFHSCEQESLKETASTVAAMKDANKALKKQFKTVKISEVPCAAVLHVVWSIFNLNCRSWLQVEDLQDDMADLLEQAEEVQTACLILPCMTQNAMGRSYNTDDIDDADLEAELAAMEDDPTLFLSSAAHNLLKRQLTQLSQKVNQLPLQLLQLRQLQINKDSTILHVCLRPTADGRDASSAQFRCDVSRVLYSLIAIWDLVLQFPSCGRSHDVPLGSNTQTLRDDENAKVVLFCLIFT